MQATCLRQQRIRALARSRLERPCDDHQLVEAKARRFRAQASGDVVGGADERLGAQRIDARQVVGRVCLRRGFVR